MHYQIAVKRMKRQVPGWEKIFANRMSDKDLGLRICKELSKSTVRKEQASFQKSKKLQQILQERDTLVVGKCRERVLASLGISH